MQRSTDRILTTHTGSLPRPKGLLALMQAKLEGLLEYRGTARANGHTERRVILTHALRSSDMVHFPDLEELPA